MSVLKSKRKASQFEVFHHLYKMRKEITELLLRDFGYSFEKAAKRLDRKFGRPYEQLSEAERERYDRTKVRWEAFDDWFIYDQRQTIVDCLRGITREVYIANSIYPTCMEELVERRLHQDKAVGLCYDLTQELQYAIETLPVDVNIYLRFGEMIQTEINLIKGWRKADNKFKGAISTSAANFANVNNNGNANYNNASNSNGVRPDFNPGVNNDGT
jgi:hypothetical protein|nr:MAG TPA: hypothetical protein [Caudoviricetes sp.]